ncbi:hypothetical protein PybrP1_012582 [[Pythium] brassicae (nom. inval.)]|nr:hypothetical protein PybrP1_012582 [[Pythium] brassicae (nom. inval.)]
MDGFQRKRRNVIQLYFAHQDYLFICAVNESTGQALFAEQRETRPLAARQRKNGAHCADRKGCSTKQKERLLALDWSLGNIPITLIFLLENWWRLAEERHQRNMEDEAADNDDGGSAAGNSKVESPAYAYLCWNLYECIGWSGWTRDVAVRMPRLHVRESVGQGSQQPGPDRVGRQVPVPLGSGVLFLLHIIAAAARWRTHRSTIAEQPRSHTSSGGNEVNLHRPPILAKYRQSFTTKNTA